MRNENNQNIKELDINKSEEIFVGEDDEFVMNCEGGPCNFVIKDLDID